MCSDCSGFGHAAKDCPTGARISDLGAGVREQGRLLRALRAEARSQTPTVPVCQLSLASVTGKRMKRARPFDDQDDCIDTTVRKRPNFG